MTGESGVIREDFMAETKGRERKKKYKYTITNNSKKPFNEFSVTDPRCFIQDPGSGTDQFSHPGSGSKHFYIQDPGTFMKSGMQTYFFLAFYAFRSKALVLVIVIKIRDPRSGIQDPEKFILDPDPGGKKAPDPQH
jgi:hypothetical protein